MRSSLSLFATLLALSLAYPASSAHARDVAGLGIGGNVTVGGGLSGLDIIYWVTPDIAIEGIIGVQMLFPDEGDAGVRFGLVGGALFALVKGDDTHLELGARAGFVLDTGPADDETILIDVPLRVEHWFGEQFSFNAQVGVVLTINPGDFVSFGIGNTGLYGGAGFTFYFEPSSSGVGVAAAPGG